MKAEKRINALKKSLESVGLGRSRLEMYFMSAGMPDKFVECVTGFTERIQKLGPNPLTRTPR